MSTPEERLRADPDRFLTQKELDKITKEAIAEVEAGRRPARRLKSEGNIYAGAVDPVDRWVTRFTGSLWRRAEEIRPSTEPLSYEEQRYRRRKRELPDLPLARKRAELGLLNIGIGAVESFTFPVRPSAWKRTVESVIGLATSKEKRKEAVEFAKARPEAVGLQLMGGVVGGVAAGKVIGRIMGPKTYTLKKKIARIKPGEVKSPATKMPRGKWRSTWEIVKKGGTAVVELKERPGFISYYEPTPVYALSRLGFIGLSGIHGRTTTSIKSDPVTKQVNKQLQKVGFDPVQRRRMFDVRPRTKGRTEQRRTILPDVYTFVRPRPIPTLPGFVEPPIHAPPLHIQKQRQRQKIIVIPDLKLEPIQIQEQKQTQIITQIQRMESMASPPELKLRRRKKKKRVGGFDPFTFGEFRTYPVKNIKKIMKELGL